MPDGDREAGIVWRARLVRARWTIAAAVLVFAALAVSGRLTPLTALAGFMPIAMAAALVPRREVRLPEEVETAAPAAPPGMAEVTGRDLSEAVAEPLIAFGRGGTVVFANRAARDAFGLDEAGADILLKFRTIEIRQMVDALLSGAADPGAIDYVERVPVERWYRVSGIPLLGADGLYLMSFRDQSEIRRIDRMRADFIANASHELRTPLASVSGFIETLRGPARNDPAARERFLEIMQSQTARMARLIDDLLSLSRLEMKAPLRPTATVELRGILGGVIDALGPLGAELGVTIARPSPGTDAFVHGDRDELIQVFENLLENACKYGQSGGRVDVGILGGEKDIAVTIRDHGPGIAEEHIPRITERFYRVDVDTSRARKGTGLGLSIVKHILTRHQAGLSIASAPGEGATFTVHFPKA